MSTTDANKVRPTASVENRTPAWWRGRLLDRLPVDAWDFAALTVGALLCLAYVPPLQFDGWTVRTALIWTIAPLGLGALVLQSRASDRAAWFAAAALAWTMVAGIAASSRTALLGTVGKDLFGLSVVAFLGLWAYGRSLSPVGSRWLTHAVIWGAAANGAIALLQVVLQISTGPFALFNGRAYGLVSNPVYLGALCAAALLVLAAADRMPTFADTVPYCLVGAGCMLSGSRIAVAAVVLSMASLAVRRRDRLVSFHSLATGASLTFGYLVDRAFGGGDASAVNRVADAGISSRLEIWRYSALAVGERPLTGWGFGRLTPAIQRRFDVDLVRATAQDEAIQPWFDAHNVVVGLAVAVGAIGLLLFVVWAVIAGWRARGPLAWACVPVLLHWMLQPVSLDLAPLTMLALGAASVQPAPDQRVKLPAESTRGLPRAAAGVLITLGLLLASYVVVADLAFHDAVRRFDPDAAASAARLYAGDPVVSDIVAQMYALTGDRSAAIDWHERAIDAEPDRPLWWTRLASEQLAAGKVDDAASSVDEALALRPNGLHAILLEVRVGLARGDEQNVRNALLRACRLTTCHSDIDQMVADLFERTDTAQP